jgi:dTDP-glucose 4,6-dehydratase
MRILVTGGCGFIGSNFILRQINSSNNSILNYDKLTYSGNPQNLLQIKDSSKYNFIKGCITDRLLINKTINQFKPDSIIHFAAESHVDRSITNPMDFINTNILGTVSLLEEALIYHNNSKANLRFIHVSTDEVYGSTADDLFTETSPYNPSSPYSASKASSDHLVRAWVKTYDFPAIITNCSNNYGPYQFPEKLIPLMIMNCLNEKPLPVYGKGENIRDWLYVDDHCDAIKTILKEGIVGETYNIGGNNEITNLDIVKTICNILDKIRPRQNSKSYLELISFVPDRPGHDFRYAIDPSKIQKKLNWAPKETFESGISKTISWYLNNQDWCLNIQNTKYSQERLGLNE